MFYVSSCLALRSRVFSPFSIAITSLGEKRAGLENLHVDRTTVCYEQ